MNWYCESVILIRIIEKKNALKTWQANNKQARSIVSLYVSHTSRELEGLFCHWWLIASVDVRLSDVTWQGNIIKPKIELWLWAVSTPRTTVPYGEDAFKRKKESNKLIQNKMSKMYAKCSYAREYLSRILKS